MFDWKIWRQAIIGALQILMVAILLMATLLSIVVFGQWMNSRRGTPKKQSYCDLAISQLKPGEWWKVEASADGYVFSDEDESFFLSKEIAFSKAR